jgi:hypothetical protein
MAHPEPVFNFVNGRRNEFSQLAQRWNDSQASERKTVAEKYLGGRLSVILNLAIAQSCGAMRRDQIVAELPSANADFFSLIIDKKNPVDVFELRFCDEEPMLVFEVPIPSRVRLYRLHDAVNDLFRGALCKSAIKASYKSIPGLIYGEPSVVTSGAVESKFDFRDNVVEGGSEVVQRIAEREGEGVRQNLNSSDFQEIVSAIRIVLNNDFVSSSLRELREYHVEIVDMLYGPLDL